MNLQELITQDVRDAIKARAKLNNRINELRRDLMEAEGRVAGAIENENRAREFARSYFGEDAVIDYGEIALTPALDASAEDAKDYQPLGTHKACPPVGWQKVGVSFIANSKQDAPERALGLRQSANGQWTDFRPGDSK